MTSKTSTRLKTPTKKKITQPKTNNEFQDEKKKKKRETKTEESTFGIPVTIGSTNAEFGGDEFLCSTVAVTQLAIVSCGDAHPQHREQQISVL